MSIHTLQVDNPFNGRIATKFTAPFDDAKELTYRCGTCGQRVNARDLGQVFHHEGVGHKPIPPQEVK